MSIRQKLLISLILCGALLVTVPAVFNYLSFSKGLDHYLVERTQERISQITEELQSYYQTHQRWDALIGRRLWLIDVMQSNTDDTTALTPDRLSRHLALLDRHQKPLAGRPATIANKVAIKIDNETVGWLSFPKIEHIKGVQEQRFLQRQIDDLIKIGLFAVILAILFSWLLARHLVTPIESLSRYTKQLIGGNYHLRNAIHREDELGQLASDINLLAQSLEKGRDSQQRWLADISHELRTPVAILQGEIQALVDGIRQPSADNLASLDAEIEHLKKLLDDLHDLSMADSGSFHYHMETLDIIELINEVTGSFKEHFSQAGLTLAAPSTTATVALLKGDETRLRQLMTNLLTNSLKYTDAPGQVRLSQQLTPKTVVITLEDSSPGVNDAQLPHLFDHLFRVDNSRNRQLGGSGLGLAICQRIVTAHQGSISAFHAPLGGIAITITLPRAIGTMP